MPTPVNQEQVQKTGCFDGSELGMAMGGFTCEDGRPVTYIGKYAGVEGADRWVDGSLDFEQVCAMFPS